MNTIFVDLSFDVLNKHFLDMKVLKKHYIHIYFLKAEINYNLITQISQFFQAQYSLTIY